MRAVDASKPIIRISDQITSQKSSILSNLPIILATSKLLTLELLG